MNKDKLADFLNDLSKVTQKYGIMIGGCGCCGSPFIWEGDESYGDNLGYDNKTRTYTVTLDGEEFNPNTYKGEENGRKD